jgi:hypothetical protein
MANQGGQPQYRRELAGEVRDLTLKEIRAILVDKENEKYSKDFRQQVILKLAGNVLPRINEHSGTDGGPIQFTPIYGGQSVPKHNGNEAGIPTI